MKGSKSSKCAPDPRKRMGAPVAATALSAAALGVAVELRDDDGADVDGLVEAARLLVDGLALRRVQDEDDVVRLDGRADLLHLLEEGRLLLVAARRVHDDHLVLLGLELVDALLRDAHGVGLRVGPVEGAAQLRRVLAQLVVGARAERVRADHAALEALAPARESGLEIRRNFAEVDGRSTWQPRLPRG